MNLSGTIVPKSDQLNADDLIAGPMTITITDVRAGSAEQPVSICYEGGDKRPYKPSKSMRRVLVALYGTDGREYIGKKITLYRDPAIKFGGEAVGGIRISHASGISEKLSIALTESRGKRKPFVVEPLRAGSRATSTSLGELPDGWDFWTPEERGLNRATAGMDALKSWWATLSPAEKTKLKPKLDGEWKDIAAQTNPQTSEK